ncbi:hypothetical protein, partial [Akkermansia massiliensis]
MNTHSDFARRHIGPQGEERREMLDSLGYQTLDELIADIVPADIRVQEPLAQHAAIKEQKAKTHKRSARSGFAAHIAEGIHRQQQVQADEGAAF